VTDRQTDRQTDKPVGDLVRVPRCQTLELCHLEIKA